MGMLIPKVRVHHHSIFHGIVFKPHLSKAALKLDVPVLGKPAPITNISVGSSASTIS